MKQVYFKQLKQKVMNEINEIKIPKGVDRIAVKQHDDKIVIEFIPEEPKKGDLAIFWDNGYPLMPLIRIYHGKSNSRKRHIDNFGASWDNAVKWDGTKEQFERIFELESNQSKNK